MPSLRPLAASLLVLTSSANAALYVDAGGEGRLLLYPYYTVNAGQTTLVSLSNDTDKGKILKLTAHEGLGGQSVLDMNLALAPHDSWVAAVFADPVTGAAALVTDDTSCTNPTIASNTNLPQLPDGRRYVPFRNNQFLGDGGPADVSRTREGQLDVMELGELTDAQTQDVIHRSCDVITTLTAGGGVTAPTGGLRGSAAVVNAVAGTYFSVPVTPIAGPALASLLTPSAIILNLSYVNSGPPASHDANVVVDGETVHLSYAVPSTPPDSLSALLMTDSLVGDFVMDPAAGANTEWVVSQPLKVFYTHGAAAPLPPYTERFGATRPASCSPFAVQLWDREQHSVSAAYTGLAATGAAAGAGALCHSVDVLQFGTTAAPTAVLGSTLGSALSGFTPVTTSGMAKLLLGRDQVDGPASILPAD